MNNKGFTLLELLIAATIIGVLAVFATVSYKNSMAETRVEAAKTKVRQIATAVSRVQLDYPSVSLNSLQGQVKDDPTHRTFFDCGSSTFNATNATSSLIGCGYLENNGWGTTDKGDSYFKYIIYNQANHKVCAESVGNSKLPSRYGSSFKYCIDTNNGKEI